MNRLKIAVIGSGISGLTAAYELGKKHDVTVFEANDYLGGHTNTIEVDSPNGPLAVDTGFIVFNDWTYPNFIRLLKEWQVDWQKSTMSFSVQDERTGLEYNGTSLNSLFAQRRNLLRPSFYRMIRDIMRFNREAPKLLDRNDDTITLGDYLKLNRYSPQFVEQYIVPMGAAIWSAVPEQMLSFPARYFVQFFKNHGMLSIDDRPTWRVIKGGSRNYIKAWRGVFAGSIRLATPIAQVERTTDGVKVVTGAGDVERFDAVVPAVHSNQALELLADPSDQERRILGAIPYQKNTAILHTDHSILPKRKLGWAAWNYHVRRNSEQPVAVTYNMNILQTLPGPTTYCVTLNYAEAIDPSKIIRTIHYDHPVYTPAGVAAQLQKQKISGVRHTYYCGAYWGFGFHEDGVRSGLDVVSQLEADLCKV